MPGSKLNLYAVLPIICLLASLCLLLLGTAACGPSEREIEATVEARIQARETSATATAVANLPTPTPIITSPTGLQLPSRVNPGHVPHQKVSLEEARRFYRQTGCTGCSQSLEELRKDPPVVWASVAIFHDVLLGEFVGGDDLTDAVVVTMIVENWDGDISWQYVVDVLAHNGASLDRTLRPLRFYDNYHDFPSFKRCYRNFPYGWIENCEAIRGLFASGRTELYAVGEEVFAVSFFEGEIGVGNLTAGTKAGDPTWDSLFEPGEGWSFGDLDDDVAVEIALLQENNVLKVLEIVGGYQHNREAEEKIKSATKDFASNLLTDDAEDFELLWREHGPSASVAALALILDTSFHDLLDELYAAVDSGENFRETVLVIRQSRQ